MNKPMIYIVDDEEDILDILVIVFKKHQFDVTAYQNPVSLLEDLQHKKPDLILSDFKMPQMNGIELLKEVKEKFPDIPFVILSAHLDKVMMIQAIDLGISAVIEKPFKEKELTNKIKNILKIKS